METEDQGTQRITTNSLSSQAGCPERYEIKSLVGQGGMGMVFHAFDSELSRDVAIKILLFEGARDKEAQTRFMREAQVLSRLNHPNIVRIFSSGINSHGNPYHVMEYLQGISLAEELSTGRVSASKFHELMTQILAGLAQAHEIKVAHRDLKPSNIMCCKDSEGATVYKLIDFGIARIELSQEQAARTITRTDAVLGSPLYISPEQCRSARGDSLSDIYSLGCIMYECISGKPPFKAESSFETMYKHMTETPAPLSTNLNSSQSIRLATLVERCLKKKPEARPQSVAEISAELEQIFDCQSDEIDLFEKWSKPKDNNTSFVVAASILILIVFLGSAAGIYFYGKSKGTQKHEFKIDTEADKISHEIQKHAMRLARWKDPQAIKGDQERNRYLDELLALTREQMKSGNPKEIANATESYSAGAQLCNYYGKDFLERKAAFLTLRARSEWMQAHNSAAESDYAEAFRIMSSLGQDRDILVDMLGERALYNLHQKRFSAALQDAQASSALYDRNDNRTVSPVSIIERIDHVGQLLDRKGDDRCRRAYLISLELQKIQPDSENEAIQMVLLSNHFAARLCKCSISKKQGASSAAEFSLALLSKIAGHEDLKESSRKLLEKSKS